MYTRGATGVRCGACHFVTNTADIAGMEENEGLQNRKVESGGGKFAKASDLVVVEHPPIKLKGGKIVHNIGIAVEIKK